MNRKIFSFIIFILFTGKLFSAPDLVNSVIGDISYYEKYHAYPSEFSNEDDRIATHLNFVINYLEDHTPEHLNSDQKRNRFQMISLLRNYVQLREFPKNYDHPGMRIPCFIDKDGNICAVGFLVAETAGNETAEKINREYKYKSITEMNSPILKEWVSQSGLTLEECAMIQPTYGYYHSSSGNYRATSEFVISSSLLGGVNAVFTVVNTAQSINHSDNKWIPIVSGITGGTQLFIGLNSALDRGFPYMDPDKKTITAFNIALGTGTIIMAVINLIDNPSPKNTTTKLSLTTIPITKDKSAYGVKFSMPL